MSKIVRLLGSMFNMLGGLLVFWITLLCFGLKPAIAVSLLFVVADVTWRLIWRKKIETIYWMSSGFALVFGAVDLWAGTSFFIRYEGAVGNLLTAAVFIFGAFAETPLIAQIARLHGREIPLHRSEVVRFLRAFTLFWAAYLIARALVFIWIMQTWPPVQALAIRTVVGWVSLGVMMALSFGARRVQQFLQRWGFFRPEPQSLEEMKT